MDQSGYSVIRKVVMPELYKGNITLAPYMRLLETKEEYILCAVNHMPHETEMIVELSGGAEQKYMLKLPGANGIFCRWRK